MTPETVVNNTTQITRLGSHDYGRHDPIASNIPCPQGKQSAECVSVLDNCSNLRLLCYHNDTDKRHLQSVTSDHSAQLVATATFIAPNLRQFTTSVSAPKTTHRLFYGGYRDKDVALLRHTARPLALITTESKWTINFAGDPQ